jgi:hypothetical protein
MTTKESRRQKLIRKAKEAREQATQTDEPWVRQMLEEIASGYDVLAEKELDSENDENGDAADA